MKIGQPFNPAGLFDGIFVPAAICELKTLSPGAKLVFGLFCRYAGEDGKVDRPMDFIGIGMEIGVSENLVRNYVLELEDANFVEADENTYSFLWHAIFAEAAGMPKNLAKQPSESPQDAPPERRR